jgi:hypothetical protein
MLRITSGKGFQMTFANGWTISVQFGAGNYCDNRSMSTTSASDQLAGEEGSANAEIAAWDKDGKWHNFGADQVKGWQTPDEVAAFIADIANR